MTDESTASGTKNVDRKDCRGRKMRAGRADSDLDVLHPHAAGIDVGGSEHYVAIAPALDTEPVRRFGCFTTELRALSQYLKKHGIRTVAMQATGVYWIALFDILEQDGFEVFLVNASHTKNLPGRKSDVQECQWLLKLHTYGLLRNSFHPTSEIRVVRSYWRQRALWVQTATECINRMQKALAQMNLQLGNVISDIAGTTGQKILRAIVAGERNPETLAEMKDSRIKASHSEIVASLTGNWRAELLFALQQELQHYDFCQLRMRDCDQAIAQHLKTIPTRPSQAQTNHRQPSSRPVVKKQIRGNAPRFPLAEELQRITGLDLTRIDGIAAMTVQTVISEVGLDMNRWKTEAHFASWLGLCPHNDVSGGKVLRRGTRHVVNRAATAFRMAALTLRNSQSYLGAQFRRFRAKLGAPKAITAMAHKLAVLFYRMMRFGQEYVDQGEAAYQEKFQAQQLRQLEKKAACLGFTVVPLPQNP
jgi:transposase